MFQILITGKLAPVALELFQREADMAVTYLPDLGQEALLERIGEFDALVSRSETDVTRDVIARGARLKVLARAAVGVGNIDIEYATEKGILVINTPGMNTNSAAELTMGLLISAMRKLPLAHMAMKSGQWDRHRFTGLELRGKTIGIIGLGNVGHRVARFARAFEMAVLAHDPYLADSVFERHGAEKVSLEALCRRADVVTLHVPKNRETTGMIGERELGWMKPGVVFLNAARGGLIRETLLLEALKSGRVRAAGIDTWEVEPVRENPLTGLEGVVMSPHIGASTEEAQVAIGTAVAQQTIRALRGEVVDYPVNLPQLGAIQDPTVRMYTSLAEKIGRFAAQYSEFSPSRLEILHVGRFEAQDVTLLRLSFLKGFLQQACEELVTYVNADRRARQRGIEVTDGVNDQESAFESAIRFVLTGQGKRLEVAGVVYGRSQVRLTQVNDFVFEMEPVGNLLVTTNLDQPGMIGVIGTLLGRHGVNVDQFELARNRPGGEAMALIRVDTEPGEGVLEELRGHAGMTGVKLIRI